MEVEMKCGFKVIRREKLHMGNVHSHLAEAAHLRAIKHDSVIELRDIFMRSGAVFLAFELFHCNLRQHIGQLQASGRI